jgi:SH3 domain-containing YSC84-like protein 1
MWAKALSPYLHTDCL